VRRTHHPASRKAQLDATILAGLRDAPFFTDAERAALALTKAVTRLSDHADKPNYLDSRTKVKQGRTVWHRQDS
jgi:alkylhydroperoxidase family enzyme